MERVSVTTAEYSAVTKAFDYMGGGDVRRRNGLWVWHEAETELRLVEKTNVAAEKVRAVVTSVVESDKFVCIDDSAES